jgi:hypothetical protein
MNNSNPGRGRRFGEHSGNMNAKPYGLIRWAGVWLVLLQCPLSLQGDVRPRLDLNGTWDFYPDVGDATLDTATVAPGKILVPGAWQAQGYGPPGGSIPSSVVGSDITPAEYLRHNLTARCLFHQPI